MTEEVTAPEQNLKYSERETSVAYTASDDEILIFSCIGKDITAMKKKDAFTLKEEGTYKSGLKWATFSIPKERFDISRAAKAQRNMTDEQRAALGDRMRALHKKGNSDD